MKTRDWLALSLLGTSLSTAPARAQGLDDLPGMGSFPACGKTQNAVPDAIEPLGANSHGESVRAWQTWHNLFCEARDEVRVTGRFDARARAALRRRGGRITWRDWWDTSNGAAARNAGSLGS